MALAMMTAMAFWLAPGFFDPPGPDLAEKKPEEWVKHAIDAIEDVKNQELHYTAWQVILVTTSQLDAPDLFDYALAKMEHSVDQVQAKHFAKLLAGAAMIAAEKGWLERSRLLMRRIDDPRDRAEVIEEGAMSLLKAGCTEEALAEIETIETEDERGTALRNGALVLIGRREAEAAERWVARIISAQRSSEALRFIPPAFAAQGRFDEAIQRAEQLDGQWKDWALDQIAESLAREGKIEEAKALAARIEDPGQRDFAYRFIAAREAARGDVDQALETVHLVSEQWRSSAFQQVVEALANQGRIDEARQVTRSIPDRFWREQAARAIMRALADHNRIEEALAEEGGDEFTLTLRVQLLAKVRRYAEARDLAARSEEYAHQAMEDVVEAALNNGDVEEAERTVSQILIPYYRATALLKIAESHRREGRAQQWQGSVEAAQEASGQLGVQGESGMGKAGLLVSIAQEQLRGGKVEEAASSIDAAQRAAVANDSGFWRYGAQGAVSGFVAAQMPEEYALQYVSEVSDPFARVLTMCGLALRFGEVMALDDQPRDE